MSVDKGRGQESDAQLAADREKVANELWAVGPKRQELEAKSNELEQKRSGPKGNDPQLAAEREKVAQDLKAVQAKHGELEGKYNDIERERFARQGNDPANYKYKHDARHEFRFEENQQTGEKRATMAERPDGSGPYTLRKRDEVINWRADTKIGASESAKAQQRAAGRSGDDAGHLVGAEFGANPADDRNLTRQNLVGNESGAFHQQERQLRDDVERGRQCGVEVSVEPAGDRSYRTMKSYDLSEDGKRSEARGGNVLHGDFPNSATRAYAQGNPTGAEALQARKDTHAHAAEVKKAVQNQDRAEIRERSGRGDHLTEAPPPRSSGASTGAGPPSRDEPTPEPPAPSPGKGRSR